MAEIFGSHSRRDQDIRNFFSNIFAGLNVAGKFIEFEEYESPPWQFIRDRVNAARAVFVLLGPHVQELSYTRDWIAWETGLASQAGKDIWVFEPFGQWCNVAIPHISHYVVYDMSPDAARYVRLIVNSYDDSGQLASLLRGAVIGLTIGTILKEDTKMTTPFGALIEAIRSDPGRTRPMGMPIQCVCKSAYRVHAKLNDFPCPTCRQWIQINWALEPREV